MEAMGEPPTLPTIIMMSTMISMTISPTHVALITSIILRHAWDTILPGDGMAETAYSIQTMHTIHGFMILGTAITGAFIVPMV